MKSAEPKETRRGVRPGRPRARGRSQGRGSIAAAILLGMLAACGKATPPPPTARVTAGPTRILHAPEIRFALIGEVTQTNVWSLFDGSGYSYNNYAVRGGYWPRLYGLSLPDFKFEPVTADGMPSPVRHEGSLYAATVSLNPNLEWSDGSPFTAEDVAFTVNTALAFQLGFDWSMYYNPGLLDHADATDAHTVKFYFKQAPTVGTWQYGILQGPVVQDKYWSSTVAQASSLLPAADLVAQIEQLKSKVASLEVQVGVLNYSAITAQGEGARVVQSGLKRQMGDLDQATNELTAAQSNYDNAMQAARAALFGLKDQGEPLLGPWTPAQAGSAAGSVFANRLNSDYPGSTPHFDRAVYQVYPTRLEAEAAFKAGQVDVVLDPAGAEASTAANADTPDSMKSPTRSMRFLVFNPRNSLVSAAPLRQALACMLDPGELVKTLNGQGEPLGSFVPRQESTWFDPTATLPCGGLNPAARLTQAAQILKGAGFNWTQAPSTNSAGAGLTAPDGKGVPALELLVPSSDPLRVAAGNYIQQQAQELGIPLTARSVTSDTIDYAVFSSHDYDMALVGWQVSLYPGYLCDWFSSGKPFGYGSSSVAAACEGLSATSDLSQAAQAIFELQSSLAADVPFVPLYNEVAYDPRAKVDYPFDEVLGGLSEVYGAPNLAVPAAP